MGYSASLKIVYGVRLFDLFPEGIRIQRNTVTSLSTFFGVRFKRRGFAKCGETWGSVSTNR
jgi:hypothetical protein